ncbi:dipeptide transport system permease protein DppC [bacterium BMS3Bbin11]|nr:dipeptide transport system permease protein DppC [bacterium BMS3Abin11]GBE45926.1 dipeptide transport system permease protein DppC [bacterium BMS3Bbin11]GMT40682.1 MAG: dipeptide ABC transporter permease DppC [bacterium]HDH16318.1 ABC transporter permease subunit [Gammaproteobacteria bacterium]HDZ77871.1 ABC transporter permease subunit [Gammaproteobacteria bacterium]
MKEISPSEILADLTPRQEVWYKLRANRSAMTALIVLLLLIAGAILAPLIATHDPFEQFTDTLLAPPYPAAESRPGFLLGTDDLGRDMFSRLLYGARYSLFLGFAIVVFSLVSGVMIGAVAGMKRGLTETVILRLMDIMLAVPAILLAIVIVAILGPSLANAALAVSIVLLPQFVRITRAAVISEMNQEYVLASQLDGSKGRRLFFQAILPNISAPLIVLATLSFSSAILDIAALGFLGLGAQPPIPEWGSLLSSSRELIEVAPWTVTLPGLAILITVLASNILGDGLRDALDPKVEVQ